MKGLGGRFGITFAALIFGAALGLSIAAFLGESPFHVLWILLRGSFGSMTNLGYSLYYATPLILTGLSVAWAFHGGMFNIGAEGQMAMGGLAMVATSLAFPHLDSPLSIGLVLTAGFAAGGVWGALAGWMKAYRGCHEVLATILLNFVSYGIIGYLILVPYRNSEAQVPETLEIQSGYRLGQIFSDVQGSPWNSSFILALLMSAVVGIFLFRSRLGFYQRMTGAAPSTARFAGVVPERQMLLSFFIAGGLAGLASANEILGYAHKAREGFTAGAGFTGIAVALLGRKHPVGIVLSAILFGALHKGSLDLDLDTAKISRDLALLIQGLIILGVVSEPGLKALVSNLKFRYLKRGSNG